MSLALQNKIILGDCLEKMKYIPDNSIDMILTDLPYGVTARNKWDSIIDFKELWKQWNRIKKETTPIILTAIQPFTSFTVMSNPYNFKCDWVWIKERGTGFLNAKKQPLRKKEDVLVFYDKQCCYNPQMIDLEKPYTHIESKTNPSNYGLYKSMFKEKRDYKTYTHSYPTNILEIPREHNTKTIHPTQKPVKLFEYLIKTYTNENDLVLDCCAGSGTTAIACINTNRRYICIEKDEKYFEMIKERIEKHHHYILEVEGGFNFH